MTKDEKEAVRSAVAGVSGVYKAYWNWAGGLSVRVDPDDEDVKRVGQRKKQNEIVQTMKDNGYRGGHDIQFVSPPKSSARHAAGGSTYAYSAEPALSVGAHAWQRPAVVARPFL